MESEYDTVAVSTRDSREAILAANNSAAWTLNINKWGGRLKYLVCLEKEGSQRRPFLVCKISAIRLRPDPKDRSARYAFEFKEYADVPAEVDLIDGSQYPVRFGTLSGFGIDAEALAFQPAPPKTLPFSYSSESQQPKGDSGITIAEAKRRLALGLGLSEEQIDIVIRA